MKTLGADINASVTLLIQGIKGKITEDGEIIDIVTAKQIDNFAQSFIDLVNQFYTQLRPQQL